MWNDQKKAYKDGLGKAATILWEQCTPQMRDALKGRSNFDELVNKPFLLLEAIREHALAYQKSKYRMATVGDAIRTVFTTKQGNEEPLLELLKRIGKDFGMFCIENIVGGYSKTPLSLYL